MAMHRAQSLSRRRLLAGAGVAIASFGLPTRGQAQIASDGFRLLRAQPVGAGHETPSARSALRYDGTLPGPTLRVRRGEELRVRLVNGLAEPTSVHWHGVRLPNAMDGVPHLTQSAVAPGASFDYRFRPPDAGTFWYHAATGSEIDRGLHGALIVEETQPVPVDRDIVLVLGGGALDAAATVLVNGSIRPDIAVRSGERLRLRLINASAARGLTLRLEGHAPWVMAIDGQPAEPLLARDGRVGLGPGNRVDLLVDAAPAGGTVGRLLAGDADEQPVARLVYERGGEASAARRAEPLPLPPNPLPTRIDLRGSLRAELNLANAKPLDPAGAPLFSVPRGRAVTLAIRNAGGAPRALHLHGHPFRLLHRLDDGWKPFWMDTLVVGAQTERIAFVADNPGKWLIGCRMLERPDTEAGYWFAVS
jgi:FtsP/CotA-like multicopper oxidase with cupredoxin domain